MFEGRQKSFVFVCPTSSYNQSLLLWPSIASDTNVHTPVQHAKRLFPLQVSPKEKIEWAYWDAEGDDWVIADKNVLQEEELPDGFEKIIGFEGRPDPASGYYCVYNEGKLVSEGDEPLTRSSKKLK